MSKKCVLKRMWQSRSGLNQVLYLGDNGSGKLDCVVDKGQAKIMTTEDAECYRLILADARMWIIEEIEEEPQTVQEEQKEIIPEEEKNDGESN